VAALRAMKRPVAKIARIAPAPSKPISWEVVLGPTDAICRSFTILWREQEIAVRLHLGAGIAIAAGSGLVNPPDRFKDFWR
jgi:hypothetical protein